MNFARMRSLLLVSCAAAILAAGCGQGSSAYSPTAPTETFGSAALTAEDGDAAVFASTAEDEIAVALGGANNKGGGRGNGDKGKDADKEKGSEKEKGKGGGGSSGSDDDEDDEDAEDDDRENHSGGPGRGTRGELSGFVTAVSGDTLTVRGRVVTVSGHTVIRHGNRRFTLDDIQVGDHVQVRGIMSGTMLMASEIKVEDTGRDNDDDEDEVELDEAEGHVSELGGTCPSLTFKVGLTTVKTSITTTFDDVACGAIANGMNVEVKGTTHADGSLAAASVEVD